jgi:hypothetical protein
MCRARLFVLAVLAAALAVPSVAQAQVFGAGFWHLNYFDNANTSGAPDAKLRISNSGAVAPLSLLGGDICAMIYVWRADQQLEECCGCLVTPNGLITISVNNNLTNDPVTVGGPPTAGVIKVVESLPNVPGTGTPVPAPRPGSNPKCDPASPAIPAKLGAAALAVWGTHIQDTGSGFLITETGDQSIISVFSDGTGADPNAQAALCLLNIQTNGSGHGRCQCPGEGPAAADPPPVPLLP